MTTPTDPRRVRIPRIRTSTIIAAMVLAFAMAALAAPSARAGALPLVWSGDYATTAADGFNAVATGPDGAVYAAGYAQAGESGDGSQLLLVKYIDTGAIMSQSWSALAGQGAMTAVKVAVDPSGSIIVAGNEGPFAFHGSNSDIAVLKFSPAGDLVWKTTYDGSAHRLDYVTDLALDADGDAVIVGASAGGRTGRDYVTVKVNADGSRAWARRYAGPSTYDEARSVAVDPAGNVYVTGQSRMRPRVPGKSGLPRAVTISYSASGARRWIIGDRRRRAASGAGVMYCGVQGAEGIVLSGVRFMGGREQENLFFAKYRASDGDVMWSRTLSAGTRSNEWSLAAALDGTGAPIAVGYRNKTGGLQAWLAGVSATGGDAWQSSYSSTLTNPGWAEFGAIAVAGDGRVLAAGDTASAETAETGSMPTTFLVRYSPGWPVTTALDYLGEGSATTHGACTAVAIGANGMYAVGRQAEGNDDSDAVLLKFRAD